METLQYRSLRLAAQNVKERPIDSQVCGVVFLMIELLTARTIAAKGCLTFYLIMDTKTRLQETKSDYIANQVVPLFLC